VTSCQSSVRAIAWIRICSGSVEPALVDLRDPLTEPFDGDRLASRGLGDLGLRGVDDQCGAVGVCRGLLPPLGGLGDLSLDPGHLRRHLPEPGLGGIDVPFGSLQPLDRRIEAVGGAREPLAGRPELLRGGGGEQRHDEQRRGHGGEDRRDAVRGSNSSGCHRHRVPPGGCCGPCLRTRRTRLQPQHRRGKGTVEAARRTVPALSVASRSTRSRIDGWVAKRRAIFAAVPPPRCRSAPRTTGGPSPPRSPAGSCGPRRCAAAR
jgi:hypothetical protein